MVNKGLDTDLFYKVFYDKFPKIENSLVFILPVSSCFNCFEDLLGSLEDFYKNSGLNKIIVIRNNNIKEREIRFSLQNVVSSENVYILNIEDIDYVQQHNFFPKIGFLKNGKLSCIEVFEQGNTEKISRYFEFLELF